MTNIILLLAVLFSLAFLGLLWLRQSLLHKLSSLTHHEVVLRRDLQKQRDTVPLILEGLRESNPATDAWRKMVQDRAQFHTSSNLKQELEFASNLQHFISENSSKSLKFLEGKKDIEELGMLVLKERESLAREAEAYNEKRKGFPYSVASAIFGLRDVTVL